MSERRSKGLCYFCDKPHTLEHSLTHKKLQIHVMETQEHSSEQEYKENENQSVSALTGAPNFRTMRVTGYVNKHPLHSVSTHYFLDIQVAKKSGCLIEERDPLAVADGNKITISSMVNFFLGAKQTTNYFHI